MLYHMSIGDSYGAAFEFVKPPYPAGLVNDGQTFQTNPQIGIGNGLYTDDTQMALVIAEMMLAGKPFNKLSLANQFLWAFNRDRRKGYGSRFYEILMTAKTGEELLDMINPNSTRSGACMRAGPLGLYKELDKTLRLAKLQASITHDTPEGHLSAQAVAAMTHFFAHQHGAPCDLGVWLERATPGYEWSKEWTQYTTVEGMEVAAAAISVVMRASSLTDVLRRSVDIGGDTDTIAAVAMFAASLAPRYIEDDLPSMVGLTLVGESGIVCLDDSHFGTTRLKIIDHALHAFVWAERNGETLRFEVT